MIKYALILGFVSITLMGCPPPVADVMPLAPSMRVPVAPLQSGVVVVVVLDTSGSMSGDRLAAVKRVWAQTLSPKLSSYLHLTGKLEVGVVNCGGDANVISPITSNIQAIDTLVSNLVAGGGTPLGSALTTAYAQIVRSPREHKAIFVLTDGKADPGQNPRSTLDAMRERNEGIDVYLVGFQSDIASYTDFQETGAHVVMAEDPASLDRIGSEIFSAILKPEAE